MAIDEILAARSCVVIGGPARWPTISVTTVGTPGADNWGRIVCGIPRPSPKELLPAPVPCIAEGHKPYINREVKTSTWAPNAAKSLMR